MKKDELISAIAERTGESKEATARTLDTFVEVLGQALRQGDEVPLAGAGKFVVRERAARSGRNPKTGETISIPASKAPAFKAGKALKDAIS